MKLRPARRKKHCKLSRNNCFPIINNEKITNVYVGHFNGFCIIIKDFEHMNNMYSMGFFGKGNLSRSFPNSNVQKKPNIIRKRQHECRKKLNEMFLKKELSETVIILNDSDSENEDCFNITNPELVQTLPITETLNLCLEEAYFLSNILNCLIIYDSNNKLLDKNCLWNLFATTQSNFIQNFVVYYYFRVRKWVVKSGIKFGGDFLLYKEGPPFYHASYLVIINVTCKEDTNIQKSFHWTNLIGLNRLTETAAKEVLICNVIWPTEVSKLDAIKSSNIIKQFSVNTILMRRWIAKHERKLKE